MRLFVEAGMSQLPKWGEELCGDDITTCRLPDALIGIMSDGLGSGVKANILATLTTRIAASMLKEGAQLEDVVDTISGTLPICKVRGIAYSTFTIIQVYRDGHVYFARFDNPEMFVFRGREPVQIESVPRTIEGKTIFEGTFGVADGDMIVAVSDGIVHSGLGGTLPLGWQRPKIEAFLKKCCEQMTDVQAIAERVTRASKGYYGGRPGDDASTVVLRVRPIRVATIAVGPPRNRQDDSAFAKAIKRAEGKKVICGGTTAQIISRELHREVTVDLSTLNPKVPPAGSISGFDLVTEGIITLSTASEKIREFKGKKGSASKGDDGASRLARLLMESDEISFMVGLAINPAHQNPGFSLNLALKRQVISEIASALQERGKLVSIRYF
jgi:hypothetical protein